MINVALMAPLWSPKLPSCPALLYDTFTGPTNTLIAAHSPEISPAGFSWTGDGKLSGTGQLIPAPSTNVFATCILGTPATVNTNFTVKLVCTMPG